MPSNETKDKPFLNTPAQQLTLLYLKEIDISGLSPEELVDKYTEVYMKIRQRYHDTNRERISNYLPE